MMGKTVGYAQEYERQKQLSQVHGRMGVGGGSSIPNLLTDRSAYMTYLETQLDRVNASCMAVQAFADRIQQIEDHTIRVESRLQSLSQEMQIGFADGARLNDRTESENRTLNDRTEALENRCKNVESQIKQVLIDIPDIETQVYQIVKAKMASLTSTPDGIENKINTIVEKRIEQLMQSQTASERTCRSALAIERDEVRAMCQSTETRITSALQQHSAEVVARMNAVRHEIMGNVREQIKAEQVRDHRDLQFQKLSKLQEQITSLRPGIVSHLSSLNEKVSSMERAERDREDLVSAIDARSRNAEQICTRLARDALNKIELHRREAMDKIGDLSEIVRQNLPLEKDIRHELLEREKAMATLISNTERQVQRLADAVDQQKRQADGQQGPVEARRRDREPNQGNSDHVHESRRIASRSKIPQRDDDEDDDSSDDDDADSVQQRRPAWMGLLSKWRSAGDDRPINIKSVTAPSSSATERGDGLGRPKPVGVADGTGCPERIDHDANLKTIIQTIDEMESSCQKGSDTPTTPGAARCVGNGDKKRVPKKAQKPNRKRGTATNGNKRCKP